MGIGRDYTEMERIVSQRKVAVVLSEGKAKPTEKPVCTYKTQNDERTYFRSLPYKMLFSQPL